MRLYFLKLKSCKGSGVGLEGQASFVS
jgi:hypothetical protein